MCGKDKPIGKDEPNLKNQDWTGLKLEKGLKRCPPFYSLGCFTQHFYRWLKGDYNKNADSGTLLIIIWEDLWVSMKNFPERINNVWNETWLKEPTTWGPKYKLPPIEKEALKVKQDSNLI